MPCYRHDPEYDETVDETYCRNCLERLPNQLEKVHAGFPHITRPWTIWIALALLGLYLWYPSQRDPATVSTTPCWDLNRLAQRIEVDHVDVLLSRYNCGPTGRFDWQELVP